ncbi:hypothetical protein [Nocardia sp. NPDC046763]|uniref:hypothetical protein n=1 Tax=Nocardia sp. NPDC046763 TaxID=3155256 RepID=UPI00340A6D38
MRHHTTHRIGWGATTLAVAATIAALSTPTATADIEYEVPNAWDCSTGTCTLPSTYVVGHTYSFDTGSPGGTDSWQSMYSSANFYDDGKCLGSISLPHAGHVAVTWVPTTTGTHKLSLALIGAIPFMASQPTVIPVSVVAAPPGSPTPQQPPQQGTCVGSGSGSLLGSGSANLLGSGS